MEHSNIHECFVQNFLFCVLYVYLHLYMFLYILHTIGVR